MGKKVESIADIGIKITAPSFEMQITSPPSVVINLNA
jgi:hypothetical protein